MRDMKNFTKRAVSAIVGCAFVANMLVMLPRPARADDDKKDGGKKIIIVVGPITKTPDKKR